MVKLTKRAQDKYQNDEVIITSVVAAVVATKAGDYLINSQIFDWVRNIPHGGMSTILGIIWYILLLVMITFAAMTLIKWFVKKGYED